MSDIRCPLSGNGPHYLVEGTFDGSGSFDIVNRSFARALEEALPGRVAVFPSEGRGRLVGEKGFDRSEGLHELISRFDSKDVPHVNIRSFFPLRVLGMSGRINLLFFPWEETLVPHQWVEQFNLFLDGILVPSAFVKKALVDSGVSIPIEIVGHGLDHFAEVLKSLRRTNPRERTGFLHISSCLPRKGVDVLLKAYSRAFGAQDPVTLTIKTFPGELNRVQDQIRALKELNQQYPDIVLINRDLEEEDLARLYLANDALVLPSRGEGFGLPLGEAMLAGIPVITTGYGGQTDFCTPENTWLVDFTLQKARSHFNQKDSVWAEPDAKHLELQMRAVYEGLRENSPAVRARTESAQAFAQSRLRWSGTVERTVRFVRRLKQPEIPKHPLGIAWITPCSEDRDIADYSRSLLRFFDKKRFRLRVYSAGGQTGSDRWDDLVATEHGKLAEDPEVMARHVLDDDADCVVIQYHPSLFPSGGLSCFIEKLSAKNVRIVLSLHRTRDMNETCRAKSLDFITNEPALCDRILVKSIPALNRMKALGLIHNVTLFPHGIMSRQPRPKTEVRDLLGISAYGPVISSLGPLEEQGGAGELIRALPAILEAHPKTFLLLVNRVDAGDSSVSYRDDCVKLLRSLGVSRHAVLVDDQLTERESLLLLEAADVAVFPAQVSDDSQIASVSLALAAGRPILTTDVCASGEFEGAIDLLPGRESKDIAHGLLKALEDPEFTRKLPDGRSALIKARSWGTLSVRLQRMILALVRDRQEVGSHIFT
ncbi:MAG: glycosyltransferase [Desulfomonilaceae bacterium]|nr:glycosyltransferase [Desulfomonilaceae bacterium]